MKKCNFLIYPHFLPSFTSQKIGKPPNINRKLDPLLSIPFCAALSKEVANIKIPVIIDTPLGRLDSKHRHQLITKYFPEASLQTIILSTDEEIIGSYYKLCKPYVGEEYLCTENPKIKTSGKIIKGYF